MNKNFTIVANWKMYFTEKQAIDFLDKHFQAFRCLSAESQHKIVICPSFTDLALAIKMFSKTEIQIGAQDCATNVIGAFTGQTSAARLRFLGCSHCIVGHSERRIHNGENPEIVAQKALRALESHLSPIICIGETLADYEAEETYNTLLSQLAPIFQAFATTTQPQTIYFAYEPVWAIGTNHPASVEHLEKVFDWLQNKLRTELNNTENKLLYGGSVTSANAPKFVNVAKLDGFLVGGASTDFPEFEKIVKCCNT